jgi:hypothetical protein
VTYIPSNKLKEWRLKNQPSVCPILKRKTNDWVVDHDHITGEIRGVISREANSLIGKIENTYKSLCKGSPEELPGVLENINSYLMQDHSGLLHPTGLTQLTKRFERNLKADDQRFALQTMGAEKSEINVCNNSKDRARLFRSLLKDFYDNK